MSKVVVVKVQVKDCSLDSVNYSLRNLKKTLQKEGIFKELKLKQFNRSYSENKRRKKEEAQKRKHKIRKQIIENRRLAKVIH